MGGIASELDARIPLTCGKMQNSSRDWMYFTEDERPAAFRGITGGTSFWPRGRVLGGSSVLNYMAAVRGAREDFDTWAAQGAAGWSWAEVEPLFKKSEDMLSLGHPDAVVEMLWRRKEEQEEGCCRSRGPLAASHSSAATRRRRCRRRQAEEEEGRDRTGALQELSRVELRQVGGAAGECLSR